MKLFLSLIFALASFSAFADETILNCSVAKIFDDNIFEEGLSREEYPEVELRKEGTNLIFDMGAMQWYETVEGAKITVTETEKDTIVTAQYKNDLSTVMLTVSKKNTNGKRWGTLKYKQDGRFNYKSVALIVCSL